MGRIQRKRPSLKSAAHLGHAQRRAQKISVLARRGGTTREAGSALLAQSTMAYAVPRRISPTSRGSRKQNGPQCAMLHGHAREFKPAESASAARQAEQRPSMILVFAR